MNLQPFPTILFTKIDEYVNYFDNLLNDIIKMAKENEEMKIIYLKFLYDFFIEDKTKEISELKGEIISDMFTKENSNVLKTPKKPTSLSVIILVKTGVRITFNPELKTLMNVNQIPAFFKVVSP